VSAKLKAAQRELAGKVMGRPGVAGVAVGERSSKPCLVVYVRDAAAGRKVPASVGGFPVVVEQSGGFSRRAR
jgi:hypothetical protein